MPTYRPEGLQNQPIPTPEEKEKFKAAQKAAAEKK